MIRRPTLRQRRHPVGSAGPLRCVLGRTHRRLLAASPPHSLEQPARTKAGGFAWVQLRFGLPKSPRVAHAAASSSELGGRSVPRIYEQALAQLVLRDDILHPSDVQQGQQHSQELRKEGAAPVRHHMQLVPAEHQKVPDVTARGGLKKKPPSKSKLPH